MESIDNPDVEGNDLGSQLAQYYVALRSFEAVSSAGMTPRDGYDHVLDEVIIALANVESNLAMNDAGSNNDVVIEIIEDCRKKATATIRVVWSDTIRTLVTSCRKKLANKAALNVDNNDRNQHGQRHLNTLVELLGEWSNIIKDITSLSLHHSIGTSSLIHPLTHPLIHSSIYSEAYFSPISR